MRYHLTPVRMTIKKSTNKCWTGCEEKGTLLYCRSNVSWCNHDGKQYGVPQKIRESCHRIQQSHSWAYIQTKL